MCSSKKKNKKTPNPRLITKCRMRYCAAARGQGLPPVGSCERCISVPAGPSWLAGAKAVAAWGEGCRGFCLVSYRLISKRRSRKN